jgi:hypothetical protein
MFDPTVYLITYEGQTESVYTWVMNSYDSAKRLLKAQKEAFPDREWNIIEKDVG